MMKTKIIAGMAAFGLFLSSGVVSAQNVNKTGKDRTKTGNSKLGAEQRASVNIKNNQSSKSSKGNAQTYLRLFGKKYRVGKFEWAARSKTFGAKQDQRNFYSIRVGNFRIYSENKVTEIARRWKPWHKKFMQLERSVPVGAYWLSLEARSGAQMDAEIALGVNSGKSWGVRARAGFGIYIDCTAAADFGLVRIGLRAKCKVINVGVRGSLGIHNRPHNKKTVTADFGRYHVPVVFSLKAVVDRLKIEWKGWRCKRTWKEVGFIMLARWFVGNTTRAERSFLTY